MQPSRPEPKDDAAELFAHPGVDWPTLGLAAAMWSGLVANLVWASGRDALTLGAALGHVVIGTFFLNLSFTVWHEGVHGTVFRARWANDLVGVLGSWPAMIPYFMIHRDHVLHHEHTNDRERDPDAWFLEGSIWSLPLRYPAGVRRAQALVERTHPPAWERWCDRLLVVGVIGVLGALVLAGHGLAALVAWVIPKGIAMWVHAWYVNVLPHQGLPAERYRDTRVRPVAWMTPLMLCHNYHGLHHAWQTVPWHRYARVFRAKRAFLEGRGTPVVPGGPIAAAPYGAER
jgi:fatty acid desaturase